MKIHFGLQYDSEKVWDFGLKQDFENLILGPIGLINFLKDRLGEVKPQENEITRILDYEKVISNHINNYPSLLESFNVDSFAFASKLLEIRDWLKLNEIILENWTEENQRFHLIEKVENHFSTKGFSDDLVEVKNQVKHLTFENDFSVILYNSIDTIPMYLKNLFGEFKQGIVSEYVLGQNSLLRNDLGNVIQFINGNSSNELIGDNSLILVNANDEEELNPYLAKVSQNKKALIIGSNVPSSLDLLIASKNGNPLGLNVEKPGDYWKQLPELLLCLGEERLDIRKVFQLLNHKYSLFKDAAYWIKSQLEYSQSFDFEKWLNTWEEKEIENFHEIKASVQKWLIDRPLLFSENGTAKSEELISFYEEALNEFDTYKHEGFTLQNYKEFQSDTINLIEFIREKPEVSLSRLKTVLRRLRIGKTISTSDYMTESALRCKSAGNVVHFESKTEQTLLILNGLEIEDKGLNKLLFESEINAIRSINPALLEEKSLNRWKEDVTRLFMSSDQVMLVNVLHRKGDLQEKPFIIRLIDQIANDTVVKQIDEVIDLGAEVEQTNTLTSVKAKNYWEIKEKTKEKVKFKEYESFSSMNELIHYPHSYFLANSLGVNPKGFPDFESVFAAKGTLSHAVIEHFVNNDQLDASKKEIEELTELFISQKAAVLDIPKFRMEALEVKMNLTKAIPELNNLIKEMKIDNLSIQMEKKVVKDSSVFDVGLKGFVDMVLYSNGIPAAVIDIKYTGFNKRKKDIENSADYQLALYCRLMDDDSLPKAYFLVKEAKLMTNHPSFFGEKANVFDFSASIEEQIIQLKNAVKKRKEEIKSGKVEIAIGETLEEIEYWDELDFVPNTSWKDGLKEISPYEQFKNLLG